jgi:hypothetical protein
LIKRNQDSVDVLNRRSLGFAEIDETSMGESFMQCKEVSVKNPIAASIMQ